MKSDTTKDYWFTADYYGYTVVTSADGLVSNNVYTQTPTPVKVTLSINIVGELMMDSQTKMQLSGHIANLTDRAGEEIYVGGEWIIVQTQPIIDPMGYKDGYRYRAKMISGDI